MEYEFYYIVYAPNTDWYEPYTPLLEMAKTIVVKSPKKCKCWKNNEEIVDKVNSLEKEGAKIIDIFRYEFLSKKKVSLLN